LSVGGCGLAGNFTPRTKKQPATYNGLAGEEIPCHMTAARFTLFRLPSRIMITTARLTAGSKKRLNNLAHRQSLLLRNYAFQLHNCKKIENLDSYAQIVELGSNGAEYKTTSADTRYVSASKPEDLYEISRTFRPERHRKKVLTCAGRCGLSIPVGIHWIFLSPF